MPFKSQNMKLLILLVFSLFLINGSIQGQKDTIIYIDSPVRPPRRITNPDLTNQNDKPTKHILSDFKNNLSVSMTNNEIVKKFGEPTKNIGSGIIIYVYELVDSTEVWIGCTTKNILYAKHMDANHQLIETLNLKPAP